MNKELLEKIARLEAVLAEVKEKIAALPKRVDGGVFKPEDGQKYWSIMSVGDVDADWWHDHQFDHERYEIGNCFSTRQGAEDAIRVLKLIQKARESQDGFVPDWENWMQNKYVLYFNTEEKELRITNHISIDQAPIFGFWEERSVCEQFIGENREEVLWFFTEYRRRGGRR